MNVTYFRSIHQHHNNCSPFCTLYYNVLVYCFVLQKTQRLILPLNRHSDIYDFLGQREEAYREQ